MDLIYDVVCSQATVADKAAVVSVERSEWYILVLYTVSEICVSHVSLAACCVAVMYASWTVLHFTKLLARGLKLHTHLLIDLEFVELILCMKVGGPL